MKRTQIYLTTEQKQKLDRLSKARGIPMAELVREAVEQYITHEQKSDAEEVLSRTYAIWADRKDTRDTHEYVRYMRQGWTDRARRLVLDDRDSR